MTDKPKIVTNGAHEALTTLKARLQGLAGAPIPARTRPARFRAEGTAGEPRPTPLASAGGQPFTIRQRSLYDAILDLREYVQWLDIQVNGDTGLWPPPDYLTTAEGNALFLTQDEGDLRYLPLGTPVLAPGDADLRYIQLSTKGEADGVAPLDAGGKVPPAFLPLVALTQTFLAADGAAMLALPAQQGDLAIRGDISRTFILAGNDPTVPGNWQELLSGDMVTSVNGKIGAVVLTPADIGAASAADADVSLNVNGSLSAVESVPNAFEMAVKISADPGNGLSLRADGLFAVNAASGGSITVTTTTREEFAPAAAATTVTLAAVPQEILSVTRNGVEQSASAAHYSRAGAVVTFADAFVAGERVGVVYETAVTATPALDALVAPLLERIEALEARPEPNG